MENRQQRNEWLDVRVIDGSGLIDWMHQFPAVGQWLAASMGMPARDIQTLEQRWAELRTIGEPPPLIPDLFLVGREKACARLTDLFGRSADQLRLDTYFPGQVVDFICAHMAAMDDESHADAVGRCLIVSSPEAWNVITTLREAHVLIADFDLDEADASGTRLLEKARRARHVTAYGGLPGGIPHPNRVPIPKQKIHQIGEALQKAGYATDADDFREVIKALQENPDTSQDSLFQVEWAYLPLLEYDENSSPMLLEQRLARDPAFFCEAIRIVYRSKNEKEPLPEVSQKEKDIGSNVYSLLHGWRRPPGTQKDGTFNSGAMCDWLNEVRDACAKSGHLEVALLTVGQVFTHMPPDPDGLWIDRMAAEALNAEGADDMRRGFTTALFNSRGMHSFTAGQEEREIAQKYRTQADEVEASGYHRLATVLRDLAGQYERDAEREERRDPFD